MYRIYELAYEGKPIYVGQTKFSEINRLGRHLMNIDDPSKTQQLYAFLRTKTPEEIQENLRVTVVEDEIPTILDADIAERKWIEEHDTFNNGYNETRGGGGGGRYLTPDIKEAISLLYYTKNYDFDTIAEIVHKTPGAVRNILNRHGTSPVPCVKNPMKVPWKIHYTPFVIGVVPWQIIL